MVARRLSLTLVLAGSFALGAIAAQVPPPPPPPPPGVGQSTSASLAPGTGAISGVVIDATTQQPIANAIVALGPPRQVQQERQLTDTRGRFIFRDLAKFDGYTLTTQKPGYFDGVYGGPAARQSKAVAVADGQWVDGLRLEMMRPAAVSGRVIDEAGDPVVGAHVRLLARVLIAGHPQLAVGRSARTDDRGVYRISGLDAGSYYVVVPSVQNAVPADTPVSDGRGAAAGKLTSYTADDPALSLGSSSLLIVGNYPTPPAASGGRLQAYPTTFYPAATVVGEAAALTLGPGQDREGIDVQIRPVQTWRVAGRIDGASTMAGNILRLVPPGLEDLGLGGEAATTIVGSDGRFEFLNVPEGRYTIDARSSFLEYRYRTEGISNLPSLPTPGFLSQGGGGGSMDVGPNGLGYAYTTARSDRATWARETVELSGRDLTDVVLTARRTITLSGRFVIEAGTGPETLIRSVVGPGGQPPTVFIQAQPASGSASLGMFSATVDSADGTFSITGLMPGAYVLRSLGSRTIKGVMVGDKDFSHQPIDTTSGSDITGVVLTFTDRTATLTGSVAGVAKYENGVAVIAFPAERERWVDWGLNSTRIKAVAVATDGSYRVSLPGGNYMVVAVDGALIEKWQDPAFLDSASRVARGVTLDWAETRSQALTVSEVR